MYKIYWLINEQKNKTYIGYTRDLRRRIKEHRNKKVKSTRKFGEFKAYLIEEVCFLKEARKEERYWKSSIGRKKLKKYFHRI